MSAMRKTDEKARRERLFANLVPLLHGETLTHETPPTDAFVSLGSLGPGQLDVTIVLEEVLGK